MADVEEAIAVGRAAVAATPLNHPRLAGSLSVLGIALQSRFERTGELADLDAGIAAGRDTVAATPIDHPDRPMYLSNLGLRLLARFRRTGLLADLDAGIAAGRDAVAATPVDHPNRPIYLANAGLALSARFNHGGELPDADAAVDLCRDAVAATPLDHADHALYLSHVALALSARFERTGQVSDIDEAITAGRDTVAATPTDDPARSLHLYNLGLALRSRFEHTGRQADLTEAIAVGHEAVAATPPDHPYRTGRLLGVGRALHARFQHSGQPVDLTDAISAFMAAVQVESGSTNDRMAAGVEWGRAAIDAGTVASAAEGFASAVALLPLTAWHGLPRASREEHLAKWSGLASDAAACTIRAGHPERAVELLEAGRSVLWAQILNLRADLTDLAEREPDLAARLDRIRTQLDTPLPTTATHGIPASVGDPVDHLHATQNRAVEDRMRLAREFDDLLHQVRALDGFERFLAPIPMNQLRSAAGGGLVAVVNTSRYGCHALLVTTTGVQVVDLPDLTNDQVIDRANTLWEVLAHASEPNRPFRDREQDRHSVLNLLE
jgi:hypothetical protein